MSKDKQEPRVPKASKAQLEAVRKTAERAGVQLDKEQEDSVFGLAQALDEISEGEALAHLDTRLSFIERQVERLALRRDEADRGFQGEFDILKARLEDAVKAVGSTTEAQRSTLVALEKKLSQEVAGAETRAAEVLDSVRQDLAEMVQNATSSLERSEARLRGEMKALEEATGEGSRAVTESVVLQTQQIAEQAEVSRQELEARSVEIKAQLQKEVVAARSSMDQLVGRVDSAVAATEQAAAELKTSTSQQMEQVKAQVEAAASASASNLRSSVASLQADLEASRENERREIEARIVEGQADLRMEQHLFKESVEAKFVSIAEMIDLARSDLLSRVQSSEEKAAGAAIHLEGMVREQRRQIEGGEQEWAVATQELAEQVATFRIRLEEQSARLSATESLAVGGKGAAFKDLEAMSSRIDLMEARMRGLMDDTIGKMATKLQVLSSQVANQSETTSSTEEQAGAISFLSRRVAELGQRTDENHRRLGAISSENGASDVPDALRSRIEALEASARSAGKPDVDQAPVGQIGQLESSIQQLRADVSSAVSDLRHKVAEAQATQTQISAASRPDASVTEVLNRIGALERAITTLPATLVSRQQELVSRIEELERRNAITSPTILPDRKKKGLFS